MVQWDIHSVADIIQIAVTPVFLLAGIAGLLNVMAGRLSRIVDRLRFLQSTRSDALSATQLQRVRSEVVRLSRRGRIVNRAISFAASSALVICLVVITLFAGGLVGDFLSMIVAMLFILCMLLLILALAFFLTEIFMATGSLFSENLGHADMPVSGDEG